MLSIETNEINAISEGVTTTKHLEQVIMMAFENELEKFIEKVHDKTSAQIQSMESRIGRKIDKLGANQTENVGEAIVKAEEGKQREELRRKIGLEMADVFTRYNAGKMVEYVEGNKLPKLTRMGSENYKRFSSVITELAKFRGGKSVTKIAQRAVYERFAKEKGIEVPYKMTVTDIDGTGNESVFSYLYVNDLIPDFIYYVEKTFLSKEETKS